MSDADEFIQGELVPFYKRAFDAFKENHHAFHSVLDSVLSGNKNHIGMWVMENERVIGEYTVYLDGANFSHIDNGVLSSELHTPVGIIRPYIILEKSTLEKMIQDEPNFIIDSEEKELIKKSIYDKLLQSSLALQEFCMFMENKIMMNIKIG